MGPVGYAAAACISHTVKSHEQQWSSSIRAPHVFKFVSSAKSGPIRHPDPDVLMFEYIDALHCVSQLTARALSDY
jgi:hypothetical protein